MASPASGRGMPRPTRPAVAEPLDAEPGDPFVQPTRTTELTRTTGDLGWATVTGPSRSIHPCADRIAGIPAATIATSTPRNDMGNPSWVSGGRGGRGALLHIGDSRGLKGLKGLRG
jgi:hypothetical protein